MQSSLKLPTGDRGHNLTFCIRSETVFSRTYFPEQVGLFSDGNSSLGVIPERIRLETLTLKGEWYNFTLTWDPTPVQHGNVTYQVIFSYDGSEQPVKVSYLFPRPSRPCCKTRVRNPSPKTKRNFVWQSAWF